MKVWNPWKGCRECSEGCLNCPSICLVKKRGEESYLIEKTKRFAAPLEKLKNNEYRIKSGDAVEVCHNSDFFLNEADKWREECWKIIKKRSDVTFVIRVRRIERFYDCIPNDWGMGYENVVLACAVENQRAVDEKLPILRELPVKYKAVLCQPLIEYVDMESYLEDISFVMVEGETGKNARALEFGWLANIRWQCVNTATNFVFRQCGSNFIKDGHKYSYTVREQIIQAKKFDMNYYTETGVHVLIHHA